MTRRQLLFEVANLFDPTGWLTPFTITAKIWIQRLWTLRLEWNEPMSAVLVGEFKLDIKELDALEEFTLQRFFTSCNSVKHAIHCCTDASMLAYAGRIHCNLIAAKSKVGPIKTISLPRLELSVADFDAELKFKILHAFNSVPLMNLKKLSPGLTVLLPWHGFKPYLRSG